MSNSLNDLINQADQCVKCGLCLPHCPTYIDSGTEVESPRGRIALMQGMARGDIGNSANTLSHLDNCLSCQACEVVCPAKVPYHTMLNTSRQAFGTARRPSLAHRLITNRGGRLLVRLAYRFATLPGINALLRRMPGNIGRGARSLPSRQHPALPKLSKASSFNVWLHQGCVSSIVDQTTVTSARKILGALDISHQLLPAQLCCGTIAQHDGDEEKFTKQQAALTQAITHNGSNNNTVLSIATGCGSAVAGAAGSNTRHADVIQYVVEQLDSSAENLKLKPLHATILLHEPCSQRNDLRQTGLSSTLLSHIPGLHIINFADNQFCCGAAGSRFLDDPTAANRRIAAKMKQLAATPDAVHAIVSANIGCAMHLQNAIREQGMQAEVVHPITLLAEQL